VKYRLRISKNLILKLITVITVIGMTIILDIYFEKHPVKLKNIENKETQNNPEHSLICLYNPFSTLSVKISYHKIPCRILFEQSHNKLLQKYHQQHDSQILRSDYIKTLNPGLSFFLQLMAGHYYYTFPKEDPPVHS
jgi:hypothetical protein